MIKKLLITILATSLALSSWANTAVEAAFAAHAKGDFAEVIAIARPAAEKGEVWAQFTLGTSYFAGEGVTQDYFLAASWLRLAAMQGHSISQFNLGVMHQNGQGVPKNYAEAVKWYRLSAAQDYTSAQYNLGLMYALGYGVPQDYVKAHLWFNIAGAKGDKQAAKDRDVAAKRMPPQQVIEAQKMARECLARNLKGCN